MNDRMDPAEGRIGTLGSIKNLIEIKRVALRRRVWFKTLNKVERGIIDLTVKYVDKIRSTMLAKVLTAIIEKLQSTMRSRLDCLVRTIGSVMAERISEIAIKWGNLNAKLWAKDLMFAKLLTINSGKFRNI